MEIYQCNQKKTFYGCDAVSRKVLEKALATGQSGTPESEGCTDLLLADDSGEVLFLSQPQFPGL